MRNEKSEHHHRILHFRFSPGSKNQLKLTILSFRENLFKSVFPVENRKSEYNAHNILRLFDG